MGRTAAELLFERIGGSARPPEVRLVPTTLIRRGSGEIPPPWPDGRTCVRLDGVGWNNPDVPWSTLEAVLSGRNGGSLSGGPEADGGDSPAWSRKRDRYAPPLLRRARPSACPTPSCTATPTSASSTARARPRSSSSRPTGSGWTALALTDHDGMYGVVRFAEAAAELEVATVFGTELSLGPLRPAERRGRPGGHPPAAARPRSRGLPRALPHGQRRPAARRGEGPPGLRPRRAGRAHRGPRARAHRLPQGRGPPGARTAAAIPRGSCSGCASGSGPSNVAVELTHAGLPTDTERNDALAALAADAGPAHGRHHRGALRHPGPVPAGHGAGRGARPAQPRRRRRLAPARGHRAPALGRRARRPVRAPPPRRGGAGGGVRARVRVLDPAGGARTCRRSRCRRARPR